MPQEESLFESELLKLLSGLASSAYTGAKENVQKLASDPEAYAKELEQNLRAQVKDPANFIGGGAGTIRGVLAKGWDEKAATKAVDMMIEKQHPGNVWRETGTYHNPVDRKLRQEIPDADSRLLVDPTKMGDGFHKMGKIFDHPELFKNYPELAKLDVMFLQGEKGGAFYKGTRTQDPLITVGTDQDVRSVILHELQHSIQKKEGFATGSNLEVAQEMQSKASSKMEELNQQAKNKDMPTEDILKLFESMRKLQPVALESKTNLYLRSGGEVEARMVQARKDLTPEERKLIAPWTSYSMDTPWSQQHLNKLPDL